jgi:hypothetical protein
MHYNLPVHSEPPSKGLVGAVGSAVSSSRRPETSPVVEFEIPISIIKT